ncbi:BTAD domain-containing putative transcriptional regulator [Kitasatospora sp. NPDC096140]|uniref:AfsR/SARP family transcriptional regulator n=1 Tax=Kitasatospora sp. NPDC096140 TaxID=3155425 RepID=UPI0033227F97
MEFRLLGPVEVLRDGHSIPLGGSKPRTLLAVLLLAEGRAVSESQLSAVLWDSRPPRTRRAQIHTYVSRLRKLLGPCADIVRTRTGYLLRCPEGTLDVAEFRRRVGLGYDEARRERHAEASAELAAALAMWRGPALEGTTEFLLEEEQSRLEETRLAALEERIAADLAQGRHSHVLAELYKLVEEHTTRERMRAHLMTALYRSGRQADALEVYQRGRDRLAAAGLRPGPVLDRVFHAILAADLALDARPVGPLHAGARRADRPCLLPPDTADFTGRTTHVEQLGARLRSTHPDTLVISGAVGVGKSALAIHLAHRCLDAFPDGLIYVDFDGMLPYRDRTRAALGHLIEALDPSKALPDSMEARSAIYRTALAGSRVLVLIDGAVDEAQVRPLLPGPGPARALVTARARLAALGETHRTDLVGFTPQEALELLGRIVGPHRIAAEPEAVQRLLASCAYLPRAVRAAGARLVARPHWTVGQLADRLADPSRNQLDELRIADLDLRESLARAYRELPAESRWAVTQLALLCPPRISVREAAMALDLPERATEDLLEGLVEARALELVPGEDPGGAGYAIPRFFGLFLAERHGKAAGTASSDRLVQGGPLRRVAG